MGQARKIVVVLIAVVIGATLFVPFANTVAENSGVQAATNESFTASLGENESLDHGNIQSDSETIEYNNSGTWNELSASNYTMYYDPGIVHIESDATEVSNGTEMRASYDYQATDSQTTTVLELGPLLLAVLMMFVLANRIMKRMGG